MEIPGEKLKLSNCWTNFPEFENLCLVSGKVATKDRIKNIKKTMFEGEIFIGDWHKLLNNIIWIFVNDLKIAKKFDYSLPFIKRNQEIFASISDDSRELTQGLYDKMFNNINENTGQQWNTATTHYAQEDKIYLTKLIGTKGLNKVTIKVNLKDLDNFYIDFYNQYTIHIKYANGKYVEAINTDTNRNVHISKYREIPIFINAKYFNKYLDELSFNSFSYLIKSFCLLEPNIKVPSDSNGYLSSVMLTRVLHNLDETLKYISEAEQRLENIAFTYKMTDYNKFAIMREDDEKRNNAIADVENEWGDKRSKFPLSPKATTRTALDNGELPK